MSATPLVPANQPGLSTPQLPLARYRLKFEATESVALPQYSGSAWRGAFGQAFKRAVCVTRLPDCRSCLLYRSCAYSYVFETPPPLGSAKMRKYSAAPHPFLLDVPSQSLPVAIGDPIELGIVLVGRANAHLAYIVFAMTRAGEQGLGKGKGKLALGQVDQETAPDTNEWRTIYVAGESLDPLPVADAIAPAMPASLKFVVHTPLRIKRAERLVPAKDFRFADLFASLLRRVSMLSYFHTGNALETDFAALTAAARRIEFHDASFEWRDWTRYSSRQKTEMQLGGVVGEASLVGEGLEPFWPYIWLGQFIHAGHNTSMGLGRYTVAAASLPPARSATESASIDT